MFGHNFIGSLKILLHNKSLLFWTFAFPIILGSFFYMAFSDMDSDLKFSPIDVALVTVEEQTGKAADSSNLTAYVLEGVVDSISDPDDQDRVFNLQKVSESKAQKLLENDEIAGYIVSGENPQVVIRKNGMDQTIIKSVTDEIVMDAAMLEQIVNIRGQAAAASGIPVDYEALYQEVSDSISNTNANIVNISGEQLSMIAIEFYTLLAMICLYGGTVGMDAINKHLANMNTEGKRTSISRVKKSTLVLSSALAGWVVQLMGVALTFFFVKVVWNIDFGSHPLQVLILTLAGSFAGLALGVAVGCTLKISHGAKNTVVVMLTMFGCFFSGMMGPQLKYIFDMRVPFINMVNPSAMITNGYYSLYCYTGMDRYYQSLISLVIFIAVMLIISSLSLRRQKYDSV